MRVFFYHYNKPQSKISGIDKLSLHYNKKCHIVEKIICNVKTYTKNNKDQPRIVVKGKCNSISIENNIATIN